MRQFDLFYGLVRAISAQQVNLRWATVVRRRLAGAAGEEVRVGDDFVYLLRPEAVAALRVADLRALQFTTHKAELILAVKRGVAMVYLGREAADEREVRRAVAHWGDAATTAQAILLYAYGRRALAESRQ